MQLVEVAQETELSWLKVNPTGFLTVTMLHLVPFHCSERLAPGAWVHTPTAMQDLIVVHDTALSALLYTPPTLGLETNTHRVPVQRSVNVWNTSLVVSVDEEPTAQQPTAVPTGTQETPESVLTTAPGAFGLDSTDQDEPFHRSVNVASPDPGAV